MLVNSSGRTLMRGDGGSDLFRFRPGKDGSIVDFNPTEGDRIDALLRSPEVRRDVEADDADRDDDDREDGDR